MRRGNALYCVMAYHLHQRVGPVACSAGCRRFRERIGVRLGDDLRLLGLRLIIRLLIHDRVSCLSFETPSTILTTSKSNLNMMCGWSLAAARNIAALHQLFYPKPRGILEWTRHEDIFTMQVCYTVLRNQILPL